MKRIVLAVLLLVFAPVHSAESDSAQKKRELDEKCEQARAARLKPLQQQKIEECMQEGAPERGEKKTREQCENYWKDYGWGSSSGDGTRNPSYYGDIPECAAAFKASQSEAR